MIHVWPEEPRRQDGSIILAAAIEQPDSETKRLWYSIPEAQADALPANSDSLAIGCVFLSMQVGLGTHIHGSVSPSLLRNLMEYQAAWTQLNPHLSCIDIVVDQEREYLPSTDRRGAIIPFSSGVDSCFTAYRHCRGAGIRYPRKLDAALMVHGFDIPLAQENVFQSAQERSRKILNSLGLELFSVATNYREIVADWPCSHGAAIASCLALFAGGYSEGLIGQTYTYAEIRQVVEGVNALTDPLLSSSYFKIVSDGAAFERSDKIYAMRDWGEFLRYLRVCAMGPQKDRNCCECEKCIRNILTFRALGLGLPPSFEHDVSDAQIKAFNPGNEAHANIRYAGLSKLAALHGAAGPWVKLLQKRLAPLKWMQEPRPIKYFKHPVFYVRKAMKRLGG